MCLISSHGISSCLLIEIKSFPKKIPSTPFIDNIFFTNSLFTSSFRVISNDPPLETNFPGRNFRNLDLVLFQFEQTYYLYNH